MFAIELASSESSRLHDIPNRWQKPVASSEELQQRDRAETDVLACKKAKSKTDTQIENNVRSISFTVTLLRARCVPKTKFINLSVKLSQIKNQCYEIRTVHETENQHAHSDEG